MKKTLLTLTLSLFILTGCFFNSNTEEENKAELKRLVTEQTKINAKIRQKVEEIKAYREVDKFFAPQPKAPVAPKAVTIPGR